MAVLFCAFLRFNLLKGLSFLSDAFQQNPLQGEITLMFPNAFIIFTPVIHSLAWHGRMHRKCLDCSNLHGARYLSVSALLT